MLCLSQLEKRRFCSRFCHDYKTSAIFGALNKNDALLISSVARREKLIGFLKISESAFAF